MAQRNRKPKRKLTCCPCLSSPGVDEEGSGERCIPSESDEEAKLLGHFENSDDNKENFSKVYYQIKEKARKQKEWKPPGNSQTMQLCQDREDMPGLESHSLLKNPSNISSASAFKKTKNSKSKNLGNDIKSGKECIKPTKNDGYQNPAFSLSSLSLSILEKKTKGKKALQKSSNLGQVLVKGIYKSPKLPKRNKNKARPLCQQLNALPSRNPYLDESDDEQVAGISRAHDHGEALYKHKGIHSALCYFEDNILTGFKKRRKPYKGISVRQALGGKKNRCQNNLQPLLSSSPVTLGLKTYNSEEEFYAGSLLEQRESLMVKSSSEEICSSFDQSQDIFLSQSSLISRHISDSPSSSLSSPAPKRAKSGSRELGDQPNHSPDNLPTVSENHSLFQNTLKCFEKIRKHSGTKEKAIQTEDFFSSSVLATSLLFRREVDLCEKPLDLTLPGRSRAWISSSENASYTMLAAGDGVHIISQDVSETLCPEEDQTIGLGLATALLGDDGQEEKDACNQLRKPDERKYIQTKHN